MSDFILDNIGWVLGGVMVALIAAMFFLAHEEAKNENAFMAACMEDHKEYECQVLWGQARGGNHGNEIATGVALGLAAGSAARR